MRKTLFLIILTLLPMLANADVVEIDGIYYNLIPKGNVAEVTQNPNCYNCYIGVISIPSSFKYNGVSYEVTNIGDRAFHDCCGLTSVTIPNSVTNIGDDAFMTFECRGLTSVTIGNSVTSIGDRSFAYCSGLTRIADA